MWFLTLRKRFAVWKVDKWWLPFLITLLILLNSLNTGSVSALSPARSSAQKTQQQAITQPVAGQLYCSIPGTSTCEHVLSTVTPMTIPEHVSNANFTITQPTEVDIMMTQEWEDTYKMGVPIPSRIGPLGVHHALGSPQNYKSVCQSNIQLCTTELTNTIKGSINTFNDFYSCAGQKSPIAANLSTGNTTTLPLAYRPALTRRQIILFTSFEVLLFVLGTANGYIFQGSIKSEFATIILGGLQFLSSGVILTILAGMMDVAQHQNNEYGIPEAAKALAISAWLAISGSIKQLFSGAIAYCVTKAQAAAAQALCPYPFPPAFAQAEAQMCYPGEQNYGL